LIGCDSLSAHSVVLLVLLDRDKWTLQSDYIHWSVWPRRT